MTLRTGLGAAASCAIPGPNAALCVAEAADRTRARAEMIEVLDQLVECLTS
jgi:hypothetical protein